MSENTGASVTEILRRAFKPEEIGKLPRVTCAACSDRKRECAQHQKTRCDICKSYVSEKHIHIDYVGHADVTARLLEADEEWTWEFKAVEVDPAVMAAALATGNPDLVQMVIASSPPKFDLDREGNPVGLWIKLTVGGITRPGYGSCPSGQMDAVKVLIGDALRNAAMRFGVALALWAKGDRDDPSAENATASAGRAARGGRQSAGDAWDNATPANGNGRANGHANGHAVRPAVTELPPGPKELDPDAQPYADEAHEARTLAELRAINGRAREARKLASLITNPSTKGTGGLGQYIGWRRKQLEDVDSALRQLNDAANKARMPNAEIDIHVKQITGKDIESATAAELRQAAEALMAVPA